MTEQMTKTTAESIMSTELVTVTADVPIYDAVRTIVRKGLTALPVVGPDNKLIGIISEKDVLRVMANDRTGTVENYMTTDLFTMKPDADIDDVAKALVENSFRRVPIVDDQGRILGVISRRDLVKFIV
jgi:CBS domain-containing protein